MSTEHLPASTQILGPIVFYIAIPVLVSKFVLRASWRRIAQALAIWWLGFGLAFSIAGMNFDRMTAWSKYFSPIWTVPGVLVLVALLQAVARKKDAAKDSTDGEKTVSAKSWRDRSLSEQWKTLKAEEKRTVLMVIGGFCLFLFSFEIMNTHTHQETLRAQFHLPKNAAFEQFRTYSRFRGGWPRVEGIVRFSEEDFKTYTATLWNPNVWKPRPFKHGDTEVSGPFASDAYSWRNSPPLPLEAGDRLGNFDFISSQKVYGMKRGRYFCFAVQKSPSAANNDPSRSIASCYRLHRGDDYVGYAAGALDEETRTLHMIIN